ncbi:MAG TPA: macro domain-containing protein [Sphingomonadaceae bacterium]|nr:macro domain-containing protein [Sphingomonadaceae bacterium]
MKYFAKSLFTYSFWRYALLSWDGLARIFAAVGFQYTIVEIADFFSVYTKDKYSKYAIIGMVVLGVIYAFLNKRPIRQFIHRIPGTDLSIEVKIGDLFDGSNDVIVSTNTTFDTDMASGLIDTDSIQGQVATKFFNANTDEIDRQLDVDLAHVHGDERADAPGKKIEYPIGTVARVKSHNRTFYFVAMSRLNNQGNAKATLREIEDALDATWAFIAESGELRDISIPLMGTGRGRTGIPRRKMVERIAQSFADGSRKKAFSNKLSIFIRLEDADRSEVNLYQIRDYLVQGLHV